MPRVHRRGPQPLPQGPDLLLDGAVIGHTLALILEPAGDVFHELRLRLGQAIEEDVGAEFNPDGVPVEL